MAAQAEQLLDKFEDMERAVERDVRRAHKRLRSSYFCWIVAMCETSAPIRALTRASDGSSA
jgi:hypothetical protein